MLLMVLLMAGGTTLRAQDEIGFSQLGFLGMPDTVYSGDTLPVGAYLRNYSPTLVYNDTIQVVGYIDTGSANVPLVFPEGTFILNPGDSTPVFSIFPFSGPSYNGLFRIGNNTIVIWPAVFDPSFGIGDSLTATVFVIDTISGIHEYEMMKDVRFYPVPSSGPLYIYSPSPRLVPKEAMVRNMEGKIIAVAKNPGNGIQTDAWAPGIYFIEIYFDNGLRHTYKVLRK
jgi:hypothetical protein